MAEEFAAAPKVVKPKGKYKEEPEEGDEDEMYPSVHPANLSTTISCGTNECSEAIPTRPSSSAKKQTPSMTPSQGLSYRPFGLPRKQPVLSKVNAPTSKYSLTSSWKHSLTSLPDTNMPLRPNPSQKNQWNDTGFLNQRDYKCNDSVLQRDSDLGQRAVRLRL